MSESHEAENIIPKKPIRRNNMMRRRPKKENQTDIVTPDVQKTNNTVKSKAFNPYHKHKNNDDSFHLENTTHTFELYKPFTPENNLYTYIKQTSGFNPVKFWELLNLTLTNKKFEDIKTERLSLISYVVIYDKESIYSQLLNQYFESISQEEIEKSLFPLSLSKHPIFIEKTIEKYDEKYSPSISFQHDLITSMAKFSYRKDNNIILLNWLNNFIKESELKLFWEQCIKDNNTPLFEQALNFKKFNEFLRNNYDDYVEDIKSISKNHTAEKAFLNPSSNQDEIEYILNKNKSMEFPSFTSTTPVKEIKKTDSNKEKITTIVTKKKSKPI